MNIEMNVVEYDLNSVIPANVIAPFSQASYEARTLEKCLEQKEADRREEERKSKINQRILDSGIIADINAYLLDGKDVRLLIEASGENNHNDNYWYLDRYSKLIPQVTNNELLDWLNKKYTNAGYKTFDYEYSRYYYKDRSLAIYAPIEH